MNHKILETLEFGKVTSSLADLAVTDPGKALALKLVPVSDAQKITFMLDQTAALSDLLRVKGKIPLTNFAPVQQILQRLKLKAELNAQELANILLIFSLADDVNRFVAEVTSDDELDLNAIADLMDRLSLPEEFYQRLRKSLDFDGTILDSASPRLAELRHAIASNEQEVKGKLNELISGSAAKYLSEAIVTLRDERYVIPVKQEYRAKFGGVVHDQSASGQTLFIEPASVLTLNNRTQELQAQQKQEIRRILLSLSENAQAYQTEIINISDSLAQLDFIQAKALLAKKQQAVRPILTTDQSIMLRQARHPLLDQAAVVANDIYLGQDFDTMLITGPNTGGKTLTLKTVGLLELMAQAGMFIPAAEDSQVGVFTQIFADIGDEQSIEASLSTFSSHMVEIISIMQNAARDSLILIDEIGAGTDPEEGARLAIAVLDDLQAHHAKIMVTTHYPELKLYGYNRERTSNASMEFDLKKLSPTYRLQIGVPGQSNAFAIAKRLGMNPQVVQQAEQLMDGSDSDINQMIETLSEQTKQASLNRARLQSSLDRARKLQKQLRDGLDIYHQRIQKQYEYAQSRADELVAKKRKQADRIIAELEDLRAKGGNIRENELIDQRGRFNQLQQETNNLANNRVLKRAKAKKNQPICVGDQVKVLTYGQTGTVTNLLSDKQLEVQLGIMKIKVAKDDLELVGKVQQKAQRQVRATRKLSSKAVSSQLDLRGQRYEEALTNLDRYLDAVLLAGLSTVTIVHGIGTGAIREGVQQYLKSNRHVKSFNYAPANEGGTGATIVQLK